VESLAPVFHACNPIYSGSRDQEDLGSKPARANSSGDPILEIPNTQNRADKVSQVVEQLPSKYEILSLNPRTAKIKNIMIGL
jgi:hypothetical protein